MACHSEADVFIPYDHLYSVKLSRPGRGCGWCTRIGPLLSLYVTVVLFPVATVSMQNTSPSTNFSYLELESADDFLIFGKTRHNPGNLSFTVNPGPMTSTLFLKMFLKDKLRMKSRESSTVASFSTSFTFSITQSKKQFNDRINWLGQAFGFMFTIISEDISTLFAERVELGEKKLNYFGVEFDTRKILSLRIQVTITSVLTPTVSGRLTPSTCAGVNEPLVHFLGRVGHTHLGLTTME